MTLLEHYLLSTINKRNQAGLKTTFYVLYEFGPQDYTGEFEDYMENCLSALNNLKSQRLVTDNDNGLLLTESGINALDTL